MILGAGGVVWLSQDAAGRPAAQGAESKDGGIVGEPGRRPAAGQTLWTQTEVWNYSQLELFESNQGCLRHRPER